MRGRSVGPIGGDNRLRAVQGARNDPRVEEMTQAEREAIHALQFGLSRDGLSASAQAEYDRLARDPGSVERKITRDTQPVLIVTTNEIPGYRITAVQSDVFGLVVRARNIFSNIGAQLTTVGGGEVTGYTKLLTDSRNQARDRMWREARSRGANAVVAMRFDCNEIGDIMSEIAAYGTAVTVEPLPTADNRSDQTARP
jgi:uncharacterized protein YbjQ (UPF0145 family)